MIQSRNLNTLAHKGLKEPAYGFRVLRKRFESYVNYLFSKSAAALPESITLFLTHRCNLTCKMCGQWGEGGITRKKSAREVREELSLKELKSVIDDIGSFRPNITLFGGEPLLHSGCLDLIRYVKAKFMHCIMITNGFLLDELAGALVDSRIDALNVSLDGGKNVHDEIRGHPGLFEKVTKGLKQVRQMKKRRALKKPLVNLQCTITKYNLRYLEQLIDAAEEVGADSLTFHNLIFVNNHLLHEQKRFDSVLDCASMDWEGFNFKPEIQPKILYEEMKKILSRRYVFNVSFFPDLSLKGLREYYADPSNTLSEYKGRCISPWMAAYVLPQGDVRPCLNSNYSYGNIKKDRFRDLWNGDKARKFRGLLKENRMFPACARCTELFRY